MTKRNYATVNPCVMCQPMGSALAFKGIENTMVLYHGSQGCSTYMRLHLAHHFREPVDIASSSLSEKGAVYGGKENMKKKGSRTSSTGTNRR
ncbi:nitrogenase component 1 [Methanosarcina horonobensis]|uniref:nitrogenase component 1 n=1 Tax=Methanosarcina horonobensis TaxID=418008 RepID=UPI000AAFA5A1|nr:nitrogenase component 1 [Methanosarcina horonobensis]